VSEDPRLSRVLAALEQRFGAPAGAPVALSGGITNRNVRVRVGAHDVVVRLPGADTELLGIDRGAEHEATVAAWRAGVGPEVVLYLEQDGVLVTRFVAGRTPDAGELTSPPVFAALVAALRAVHAGPPLRASFSPFAVGRAYRAIAVARGAVLPAGLDVAERVAEQIEPLVAGPDHAPVPCHDDLLAGNVLLCEDQLCLLDWEYAGMGDRHFDLANLAVNNDFTPQDDAALLEAYFGPGGATPRRRAVHALMRLMSDYREAWWGIVQGVVSDLDVDFAAYAGEHLDRMAAGAGDPAYVRWLADAGT